MKDKILLLFSGGIDSTGYLYKALTEGYYVHAHHVHIITRVTNYEAEADACKNIVKWFEDHGYDFQYSESTIDLSAAFPKRVPWDTEIAWSIAAMLCQVDPEIKYASTGRKADDSGPAEDPEARERLDTLFSYMTNCRRRGNVPVKNLPLIAHMTKKEIWEMMPIDLRELAWYCSHPEYTSDGKYHVCGYCHTCEDVKKIL